MKDNFTFTRYNIYDGARKLLSFARSTLCNSFVSSLNKMIRIDLKYVSYAESSVL